MSASRVTYSNLFSQAWQNVYSIVDTRANIANPASPLTTSRVKFVYEREPHVKKAGFAGFPFIIVNPAELSFGEQRSLNMKSSFVEWSISIEVVTSDVGGVNTQGKGNQHMNDISDDIVQTFNNSTIRNTLRGYGLYFFKPDATGVEIDTIADVLVFRRTFVLGFRSRMQVSS